MRGFSIMMKIISIACVASVSVRFRRKERGTRVKDRAINGANIFWLSFYFSSGQNRKSRPSRNFLVIRFMEEMLCSCSLCFSLPLIFTLVNATISHFLTAAIKFSRFSSKEIGLRCFLFLALALSQLSTLFIH